jgi:activating signal cointegrator complex subunit 3
VSRMRFISTQTATPIRFVGLSTALANPRDLGDWLGIGDVGLYNFRPSVRPIPMTTHIMVHAYFLCCFFACYVGWFLELVLL